MPATAFRTWTRIDMPDAAPGVYGGGTPTGLVAFDGGYLAVGTVNSDCCDAGDPASRRGIVWTSADGRSWELQDTIPPFEHASLHDVLTDGTRLFAIGTFATPFTDEPAIDIPAVWVSVDGATWVRTAGHAPSLVAAGTRGLIGAVIDDSADSPTARFVSSADGLAWTATSHVFEADVRGVAMAADGSAMAVGAVAGTPRSDGGPTTDLVAWRSADGVVWSGPDTMGGNALPIDLASGAAGFLLTVVTASGSINSAYEVWRLRGDGDHEVVQIPLGDEESVSSMFVIGDALLMTGSTTVDATADATVWVSTDGGATWGLVEEQAALSGLDDAIVGVTHTEAGLLAVGWRWDAASGHPLPEAWISAR